MSISQLTRERPQTEQLLTVLQEAQGAEVTYDELREAGIESPATAVLRLELAGVPVERCYHGRWLQRPSCRLPTGDDAPAPRAGRDPQWGPVRVYGRHSPRVSRLPQISPARILSAAALLAAVVTVAVLVLRSVGSQTSPVAHRTPSTTPALHPSLAWHRLEPRPSQTVSHHSSRPVPKPATPPPAPVSTSPSALESRGHSLLESGQYASAIPVLQQAVRATGESPDACAQPTTQTCLTYAFALFDLGRALRLSGDPAAAIPVLQLRLRIDNQRDAVAQELALAQGGSSGASPGGSGASPVGSGASPSALEARGHSLLESGQYASAIPVLQQAVRATGESPDACAQPTTQTCLTYAFALYDLARALRLSGDPGAAVPILQLRLRIDDQRDVVAQELKLAESGSTH